MLRMIPQLRFPESSLFIAILLTGIIETYADISPTENYIHSASFGSEDIKLYWKVNETDIVFEVHGRTTGWIGIGFSPNGGMKGSDIFVGWIKNGITTVTDRHGIDNAFPPKDPQQNLVVLAGIELEDWTMFKFSRQLAKCEENYDREITADTQRVIYAWSEEDPEGSDISTVNGHSSFNRGSKSIYFIRDPDSLTSLPVGPSYKTFDILAGGIKIPAEPTYYGCKLFKLPNFDKKYHIVKTEAIIQSSSEAVVHHMLVLRCGDHIQNESEVGVSERCRTPNMQHFSTCQAAVAGWAVGGGPLYYPPEAGYSIGGKGDPRYIQLEIHYDNPSLRSDIVDNSGMRFTYTDTLRENDVGVLIQGIVTRPHDFIIPPKQELYQLTGHCQPNCLNMIFTSAGVENVTVFGVSLHTHLAGRSMRVRQFRNGRELPYLARDRAYDFNYQEYVILKESRVLTKYDSLMIECGYSTLDREHITVGGYGTYDEMCLSFLLYYPRVDVTDCITATSYETSWPVVGIDTSLVDQREGGELDLRKVYYKNQTIYDYFNQINWTQEVTEKFNAAANNQTYYQVCRPQNVSHQVVSMHQVEEVEFPFVSQPAQCVDLTPTLTPPTTSSGVPISLDFAYTLLWISVLPKVIGRDAF